MLFNVDNLIDTKRKILRRFNYVNLFWEKDPRPFFIIAGYTRSGTTFYGDLLGYILRARTIHEPLNPENVKEISFFHKRESAAVIRNSDNHKKAISFIFGPKFKGNRRTNHMGLFFYRERRIVKIVRGNFYLDLLSEMLPHVKFFSVIIRHPCACVASRMALGWDIPDQSKSIGDVWHKLNSDQKKIINNSDSYHVKLAISWALDNMMALENIHNASFKFIYYENLLLDTQNQLKDILTFIGKNYTLYENRIRHEIAMQQRIHKSEPMKQLFGWR